MSSQEELAAVHREMYQDDFYWLDDSWLNPLKRELIKRIETEGPAGIASPVLNSVGVGDFNKPLSLLDIDDLETAQRSQLVLYEIAEVGKWKYLATLGRKMSSHQSVHQDERYPIFEGGMVDKLASTKLFQRLHGINQINAANWYPLSNEHTRAHHSTNVAVYMLRALQALYDKDKFSLIDRLKEDFIVNNIDVDELDDEPLIILAARLTAAAGMLHDAFTPSGGDVVKRATGMSEEDDIKLLQSSQDDRLEEVRKVLAEEGITGDLLKFVIDCVKGESSSLVGDMLHPNDKADTLDIDQIAYTLWDAKAAGILNRPKIGNFQDKELSLEQKRKLMHGIDWAECALSDSRRLTNAMGGVETSDFLSVSYIDPIEGYFLDAAGRLVNDKPDKLLAVLALRLFMSTELYRGTKMVGLDKDFEASFKKMVGSDKYEQIFSEVNLLSVTTAELYEQIDRVNDRPELPRLQERIYPWLLLHQYSSEIVEVEDATKIDDVGFNFRTGIDSLVCDGDGSVIRLSEYIDNTRKSVDDSGDPIITLISEHKARYNANTVRVVSREPRPWANEYELTYEGLV